MAHVATTEQTSRSGLPYTVPVVVLDDGDDVQAVLDAGQQALDVVAAYKNASFMSGTAPVWLCRLLNGALRKMARPNMARPGGQPLLPYEKLVRLGARTLFAMTYSRPAKERRLQELAQQAAADGEYSEAQYMADVDALASQFRQ